MLGKALAFEVGYHPCKTIHVIRVVFQDQAVYACISLGVQKRAKLEKGCVLVTVTNFGKDMTEKLRNHRCKNASLGSIFIPEKYVLRVCFESHYMRMISSLKYKCPPPNYM